MNIKNNFKKYLIGSTANCVILIITFAAFIYGVYLLATANYYDFGTLFLVAVLTAPFIINITKSLFRRKGQ